MKRTLVLGASLNPSRYSNLVIHSLLNKEEEVFALGNKGGSIKGVEIKTEKFAIPNLDTITLYLNPKRQIEYYSYIIELNPNRVIFNPGTENMELVELLRENNIEYELACTLVLLSTNQY
jgi:predicted CoA-binding protein